MAPTNLYVSEIASILTIVYSRLFTWGDKKMFILLEVMIQPRSSVDTANSGPLDVGFACISAFFTEIQLCILLILLTTTMFPHFLISLSWYSTDVYSYIFSLLSPYVHTYVC